MPIGILFLEGSLLEYQFPLIFLMLNKLAILDDAQFGEINISVLVYKRGNNPLQSVSIVF